MGQLPSGSNTTPLEAAEAFVQAINSGDVDGLVQWMTPDHTFVDADGSSHAGREPLGVAWREYFNLVPDYRITLFERFASGVTVVLLGQAEGTFVHNGVLEPENHWRVPAAWRVVVRSGLVAVWQLFANQHPMREITKRIWLD
jgi:hypothetical protein